MMSEIVDFFSGHVNAASRLHSLGWEDTAIPSSAAVANDATPRFTDEPRAQAPSECRGRRQEAILHAPPLIFLQHDSQRGSQDTR